MIPEAFVRGEWILLALIIATAVLLALVVIFGISTVVLRYRNEARAKRFAHLEEEWAPKIMGHADGTVPEQEVWQGVEPDEQLHFVRVVMRYAQRLRGDALIRMEGLVAPYLEGFAKQLGGARMEDQALIVSVLGTVGLDRYEKEVVRALDNPSPLVSMVAARTLAKAAGARHATQIIAHLDRYRSWSASFLAALLAGLGGEAAHDIRALYADSRAPIWKRAIAADALRWLSDLESRRIAQRVIVESTDRDLVAQSLRLLARLGGPDHAPSVVPLLESPDFAIRASAATAVGQLRATGSVPTLEHQVRDDESRWVALHAARALVELGREDLISALAASTHLRARLARQVLMEKGVVRWVA